MLGKGVILACLATPLNRLNQGSVYVLQGSDVVEDFGIQTMGV